MRKKVLTCLCVGTMAMIMGVTCTNIQKLKVTGAEKSEAYSEDVKEIERVSVHDPSIVKDTKSDTYYIFGSHLGTAKSTDLINWTAISADYENADNNPVYGNIYENFSESFKWAGYDDGDCANGGLAVWAPDVFWNEAYEWKDGSKGAWLLYYSASSTWKRSCIGYAASKNIEGPYSYVDTIVYSGITSNGTADGNSTRNTKWDNSYLNFNELLEKTSKNGGINEISEKWFKEDGSYNTDYAPNAIDPTIIKGKDNNLYMVYGSWSGGLFILPIDKKTGAAVYPGNDAVDTVSGNYIDRYYGTHIAGGNHQSGEGAYILYDEGSDYYYLYETYGGLTRTGGYNMRCFRSKNITGPYKDAKGNQAENSKVNNDNYGIKLIGNYQFYNQRGYCAAGHNSARVDSDGNRYLIFHQRFNEGTEYHEVRVHQQFLNKEDWPVTAVYENIGEEIEHYKKDQVVGTYEFISHGTDSSGAMLSTSLVELKSDGTVTGEVKGTWEKTASENGYDYITIETKNVVYQGVFFNQTDDNGKKTMTFSAIGNNNESIWGSMLKLTNKEMAERAISLITLTDATRDNIILPQKSQNADVTWESSDTEVINTEGIVSSQENDTIVTLTATVKYEKATTTKQFRVKVYGRPKLICGYNFETTGENGTISAIEGSINNENAELKGSASVVSDKNEKRSNVLAISNEAGAKGVNYLRLPENTFKNITKAGYTVNMWTNISPDTLEHSALFEADAKAAYPMTRIGANLIARINANGYSDVISSNTGSRGTWQMVTYTVSCDGICVYLNGKLIAEDKKDISSCFDKDNLSAIQYTTDVMIGSGFIWGDEDVRSGSFDEIKIYNGVLLAKEVEAEYEKTK